MRVVRGRDVEAREGAGKGSSGRVWGSVHLTALLSTWPCMPSRPRLRTGATVAAAAHGADCADERHPQWHAGPTPGSLTPPLARRQHASVSVRPAADGVSGRRCRLGGARRAAEGLGPMQGGRRWEGPGTQGKKPTRAARPRQSQRLRPFLPARCARSRGRPAPHWPLLRPSLRPQIGSLCSLLEGPCPLLTDLRLRCCVPPRTPRELPSLLAGALPRRLTNFALTFVRRLAAEDGRASTPGRPFCFSLQRRSRVCGCGLAEGLWAGGGATCGQHGCVLCARRPRERAPGRRRGGRRGRSRRRGGGRERGRRGGGGRERRRLRRV